MRIESEGSERVGERMGEEIYIGGVSDGNNHST